MTSGLVLFIDMNIYIFTEGRNLKIFLKENYVIDSDSYWNMMFTGIY